MKRLIILLLIAMFTITAFCQESGKTNKFNLGQKIGLIKGWGETKYTHDVVNIRAYRSTKSKIVGTLKKDKEVKVDFLYYNWYAVFDVKEAERNEKNALGYVYAPLLFNTKKKGNIGYNNYNETEINELAYQLATINKGGYISKTDVTITRFDYLLRTIDKKTFESKQEIADMTVTCQKILREKYGIEMRLLSIMEDLNESIPYGSKVKYAEIATLYIQLVK